MPRARANSLILRISSKLKTSPDARRTGRFDGDRSDRGTHAPGFEAPDLEIHLLQGKRRLPGSERGQGETTELLCAIAGIVVKVALLLDQHPTTTAGEHAHRQMVGERAGRQIHGHLLAQELCHLKLQQSDHAIAGIVIDFDSGMFGQAGPTAVRSRREIARGRRTGN